MFTDWKILPDLNYRFNINLTGSFGDYTSYRSSLHSGAASKNGIGSVTKTESKDLLIENILTYSKDLEEFGKFDVTFVHSINEQRREALSISATNFPTDEFGADGISAALEPGTPQFGISDRKILSLMGRLNYNYKDRYLASVTVRRDGSSVFGANNKYAILPSGAVSWLIHNESFMEDVDWLSQAKVRFSYGEVGNQAVSPYKTLGVSTTLFYGFGDDNPSFSAIPSSELFNPDLRWEVSRSKNLGFDLGLFNNKLTINAEFYDTQTEDLIVRKSINASLGYTSQFVNLGKVSNTGTELTLGYHAINKKDFNLKFTGTFSNNKNKILKIAGELDDDGNPIDDRNNRWFIGRSMNVYWDYRFDGIWQEGDDIANSHMPTAEPGDVRVKDLNGDGIINFDDKDIIDKDSDYLASFTTEMTYKDFDLSFDFFMKHGGRKFNNLLGANLIGGGLNGAKVDYWTPENPSTTYPKPGINYIIFINSLQYNNASYFRLKNITFGYTLPKKVSKKLDISNLRLYTSISNIWTVTDFLSYGPEQSAFSYPEPKIFEFGLNISF